jgi:hypothetical protein
MAAAKTRLVSYMHYWTIASRDGGIFLRRRNRSRVTQTNLPYHDSTYANDGEHPLSLICAWFLQVILYCEAMACVSALLKVKEAQIMFASSFSITEECHI